MLQGCHPPPPPSPALPCPSNSVAQRRSAAAVRNFYFDSIILNLRVSVRERQDRPHSESPGGLALALGGRGVTASPSESGKSGPCGRGVERSKKPLPDEQDRRRARHRRRESGPRPGQRASRSGYSRGARAAEAGPQGLGARPAERVWQVRRDRLEQDPAKAGGARGRNGQIWGVTSRKRLSQGRARPAKNGSGLPERSAMLGGRGGRKQWEGGTHWAGSLQRNSFSTNKLGIPM